MFFHNLYQRKDGDILEAFNLEQANMVYQEDPQILLADTERLLKFIVHHKEKQVPRLEVLQNYYLGHNTDIFESTNRRKETGKADYRAAHPFASDIADLQTAFSVGKPVGMQVDSKNHSKLDLVNKVNDVDAHNYELFLDTSIFGRAYEYVYRDERNTEKFVRLNPLETFIIYSLDVDPMPVMAIRYHSVTMVDEDTAKLQYVIEVWTQDEYVRYQPTDIKDNSTLNLDVHEPRTILPIIEYDNNRMRTGDFERVLSLIDLYDAAQSDTANYMSDLNDALLVIQGDIANELEQLIASIDSKEPDYAEKVMDIKREFNQQLKDSNTLFLHSGISAMGQQTNVSAEYIYKQYDVAGTEAYKKRIADDIHKFSHTPNLTDENFAANTSGVAMQYKLLGTVELAATKRRMFEKGLYRRYTVVDNLERLASTGWDIDVNNIRFTFEDNLPTDDIQTLQMLVNAGATLPQEYLYRFLPGVSDPDEIMQLMDEQTHFNDYPMQTPTDGDEVDDEAG
ncbi:hypothetical protein IV67_GL000046 [Weissella minor]|uniref:Phage portal protein n=1 Tax=Weissella minor TaxID=1620 RepID=A0A0R2JIY8_9LACO|nr:hypothetical protein IV67_GL000046 [Weissella minor]